MRQSSVRFVVVVVLLFCYIDCLNSCSPFFFLRLLLLSFLLLCCYSYSPASDASPDAYLGSTSDQHSPDFSPESPHFGSNEASPTSPDDPSPASPTSPTSPLQGILLGILSVNFWVYFWSQMSIGFLGLWGQMFDNNRIQLGKQAKQ